MATCRGFGIGIVGGSLGLTPATFASGLYAIFGANLLELALGDDAVYSGGVLTSVTKRYGNNLTRTGTGSLIASATLGGRAGFRRNNAATDSVAVASGALSSAPKSIWTVTYNYAVTAAYETCADALFETPNAAIVRSSATALLGTKWTHWVNGTATESLPSGTTTPFVVEGSYASNTLNDSGLGTGRPGWAAPWYMLMALAAVPTAGERAAATALIRGYYKF